MRKILYNQEVKDFARTIINDCYKKEITSDFQKDVFGLTDIELGHILTR